MNTLAKSGASASGPPPAHRDVQGETASALEVILSLLPKELVDTSVKPSKAAEPTFALVVEFEASLVANLIHDNKFTDKATWNRCVGVYTGPWLPKNGPDGTAFAETVREHLYTIEKVFDSVPPLDPSTY